MVQALDNDRLVHVAIGPIRIIGSPEKEFFHLHKKCYYIQKLLLSHSPQDAKLPQTDIIERITELRDVNFKGLLRENGVVVCKSVRYSSNKVKTVILQLPEVVTLDVPGHGEIEGHAVTVLNTKPTSELWVEFSRENIAFFAIW